ncbi:MAG: 5'-deoxynucleotidase [Clostridia bacterium]
MDGRFFALMFRMKYINRWGLMRSNKSESLSEHSLECCILAYALATVGIGIFKKNYNAERIALKAAFHDAPEIVTGDMPTPVKYYSQTTKAAYKTVEDDAIKRFVSLLPAELSESYSSLFQYTDDEKLIIKAADKLCAYIKCLDETSSGNREFFTVLDSTKKILDDYKCEELKFFMENCIAAFTLTLDELQNNI